MPVEISEYIISKLESEIQEIRVRALETIQSKFRCCRTNLEDLDVNLHELIRNLLKWFQLKPLTDEVRVLDTLLTILKSKFQTEARVILNKSHKRNELQKISKLLTETSMHQLVEILDILNENLEVESDSVSGIDTKYERQSNSENVNRQAKHINIELSDEFSENNFVLGPTWEMPGPSDLNSLKLMKTSLRIDVDQANVEHAIEYFNVIVNDFPGEYFLQSPFIFASLLHLLETNTGNVTKTNILGSCLELTKNLARRVTVRRLAKTYYCNDKTKRTATRKQVSIGTYCYETFRTTLNYLQEIYGTTELENINLSFLVLIEVIELICTTAVTCSPSVTIDYHIDQILLELGDFLKFIRESTNNYSENKYKINRNNSISIIYLLCRVAMFKESSTVTALGNNSLDDISAKIKDHLLLNTDRNNGYDAKLFASSFNQTVDSDHYNETKSDSFVSAHGTHQFDDHDVNGKDSVWNYELEMALLDYSLKHFYPDVYELVAMTLKVESYNESNKIKMLLNISECFRPAIQLLREPDSCTDEVILTNGLKSIDVLPIIQSDELIRNLFNAISNLAPLYEGNEQLRENAENLLLRLFCHGCINLKRLIYRLTSEKMAYFFACIMDGTTLTAKSYTANISRSNFFGLPLTTNILIEIICNGLTSDDPKLISYSENILILIIRSRNVISHYWKNVCEFLIPVLPLLLCFTTRKATLGQLIFELLDPDNDGTLPTLHLIQNNVALLFSRDTRLREEAIYRLSYLLQTIPTASAYIPNINYIIDVIPNNLCIIDAFIDPEWNNFLDLYEVSYIQPMIKLLNDSHVEPSIRHTTLIQLNVMLQDPNVAQHFYQVNGLAIILKIFDNALKDVSHENYADNVIPIVGILAKLCIRMSSVRRYLCKDIQNYGLLIRALLLFHHNATLKIDCSIVLFSLAFSEYIIGGRHGVYTIPAVCKKLLVPIKCEYHWRQNGTVANVRSTIELLLLSDDHVDQMNRQQQLSNRENVDVEMNLIWRFVRMNFASIWFGSLNDIKALKESNGIKSDRTKFSIEYHFSKKSLRFNEKLGLNQNDLEIIQNASPQNGIAHWLKVLRNATTHEQVAMSCAAIENFSNIDSVNKKQWDSDVFLNAVKRYCTIMPHGELDEMIFCKIIRLLVNLVERDFRDVHIWILKEFQRKNCTFLQILTASIPNEVYLTNIRFFEIILSKTMHLQSIKSIDQLIHCSNGSTKKDKMPSNLYERIFDLIVNLLDDAFKDRKLDKLRSLLSLLRLVTSSVQINTDDYSVSLIANKLLKFIISIKSFAQAGSNFNKNCLLTIGNLMIKIDELKIEKKYIKFLSSLCGHRDFEIRAYAWSILTKLSTTLSGAELLIKELSYLPGGFHACCLSTLLDTTEPSIVRENAAYVFATLISYRTDNMHLHTRVLPMCAILESGNDPTLVPNIDNYLDRLLKQHKLFTEIVASLEQLHVEDTIAPDNVNLNEKFISCNLVRSFCVILSNLTTLKSSGCVDMTYLTMLKMIKIVPEITQSISKSSILMLTELCAFVIQCFLQNRTLIDRVAQEHYIVSALISLLNTDLYECIPTPIKHGCIAQILTVLKWLVRSSYGFQAICDSFEQNSNYLIQSFNVFSHGLLCKELAMPVLRILTNLLVLSQADQYKFKTFSQNLDELQLSGNIEISNYLLSDGKISKLDNSDNDDVKSPAVILYKILVNLFENRQNQTDSKMHEHICKTLEALLKCSERVRFTASVDKFLLLIIDQMKALNDSIGGSGQEFVRKHGNAKMEKIMIKFKWIINIVLSWYSCDCLQDIECIQPMIKICIQLWPSMGLSFDTQLRFMKMLLFLSDDSLPVCKTIATLANGGTSQSLLASIVEYCVSETSKAKNPQANLSILELSLRIVSNCCSCIEGRLLINKTNMLHALSRLHPQVTKNQKPWSQVTFYWLRYCEVLTRYPDASSGARHLNLFRSLIDGSSSHLRLLSLQILRNMSFNTTNRSILLISDDFLYVIYSTLESGTLLEKLLVVTSIWKLIAQNFKAKNVIKNSKIFNKLRKLHDEHENYQIDEENEETYEELAIAIKYVMNILRS